MLNIWLDNEDNVRIWQKRDGSSFDNGLQPVTIDAQAIEMGNFAVHCSCEVYMYVDHLAGTYTENGEGSNAHVTK